MEKCHYPPGCFNSATQIITYEGPSDGKIPGMIFVYGSCDIHLEKMKLGYNDARLKSIRPATNS